MGLAESLEVTRPVKKGPRCSACAVRDDLSPDDLAAYDAALDDPTYTATGIARALRREGFEVPAQTIGRHRRGDCRS